jgi:O-antigen ligase
MSILVKIESSIDRYRLLHVMLLVYLFFLPFSRFSGVRNTAFILLFLLFIFRLVKGRVRIDIRDRTVQAFGVLVAAALLSSFLSPYPGESLDFIRKNFPYQVVVFCVIMSGYRNLDELKPIFYSLFAGFAALSLVIVFKYEPSALLNWLNYKGDTTYLRGYSLYATFYIPFAIGYLYSSRERTWIQWLMVLFLALEFTLSVLNNHRAQVAAIAVSAVAITLAARRFKILAAGAVACIIAGLILFQVKPHAFDRYKTLLSTETYFTSAHRGWNDRFAIWSGTLDMIKERPVLGWGYGWKKISWAARDGGFLEEWDPDGRIYRYFTVHGYGSASPHNLWLQILFEVGIVGLAAFLFFWATVVVKAGSICLNKANPARGSPGALAFLKYGTFGVLISYVLINMANGLWEEAYGVLMMTFAAVCIVLYRDSVKETDG